MNEVIQYLEHVLEITTGDIAMFRKELGGHQSIDPNFVRHTNELLAKAQHEHECLNVVIDMLKDELGWEEEEEWEAEADAMLAEVGVVNETEVDASLAALRQSVAERKASQSQNNHPSSDITERFAGFRGYEYLPEDELKKLEEGAMQQLNDIREAMKAGA